MFGSVRAAQPLSTPVPSELSAILEAPVRNVLIHINGPSNSSASHVRFGSGTDMTASTYDVRSTPESRHCGARLPFLLWAINGHRRKQRYHGRDDFRTIPVRRP
jgi:hypothetical protein